MAGHSHAANIQYKKGANDAKKAKIFTKIARDIAVAAKNGLPNPDLNPKLKIAVSKARLYNMPKDKIELAIAKANKDTTNYENVRYNAFFERGISLIIEGLTDNKNRTASDIRGTLAKFGAQLASTGGVEFMYEHIGRIIYQNDVCDEDKMFEISLNAGANDVINEDGCYIIETTIEDMLSVAEKITKDLGGKEPQTASWFWKANEYVGGDITDKDFISKYQKLIDALEDIDDVSEVFTNADIETE
jgi:YebC/PmpR family DNA-binding regulatory protein